MKSLPSHGPAIFQPLFFCALCTVLALAGCDLQVKKSGEAGDGSPALTPAGGAEGVSDAARKVQDAVKQIKELENFPEKLEEHQEANREIREEGKRHMANPPGRTQSTPDDLPPPPVQERPQPYTTLYPPPGPEENAAAPKPAKNGRNVEKEDREILEASMEDDSEGETLDLATPGEAAEDEDFDLMVSEKFNKPIELGEPFFEKPENLVRLDKEMAIWVDKDKKNVVLQGWVCQTRAPLEFFMCTGRGIIRLNPYDGEEGMPDQILQFMGAKTHEAVLCVDVRPSIIHAGLLAIGAKPGEPVSFQPEFKPATGEEIDIRVRWKDADGKIVEKRAQELVRDAATGDEMDIPWVFAGSFFYTDEEDTAQPPKRFYAADSEGEIIGVSNFPSAMLDVPKASSDSNAELIFQANQDTLPERGTPVTILMRVHEK